MKAEAFMVANSASISGWLLNIEGGGWEHFTCDRFPVVVRGAMAGFCVMEESDFGTTPALVFKITTADEPIEPGFYVDAIYSLMGRGRASEVVQSRFPFAQPFEFGIVGPRLMRAAVLVGDEELAAVTFNVRTLPQGTVSG
jgi:hypothetical protein